MGREAATQPEERILRGCRSRYRAAAVERVRGSGAVGERIPAATEKSRAPAQETRYRPEEQHSLRREVCGERARRPKRSVPTGSESTRA